MDEKRRICSAVLALAIHIGAPGASGQPAGLSLLWSKQPLEGNVTTVSVVKRGANLWVAGYVIKDPISGVVYDPGADAFVSRMDTAGNVLWTARLAGSQADLAGALAVDNADNAYLAGSTMSADFPLKNAFQSVFPPPESGGPVRTLSDSIGFLTRLDAREGRGRQLPWRRPSPTSGTARSRGPSRSA